MNKEQVIEVLQTLIEELHNIRANQEVIPCSFGDDDICNSFDLIADEIERLSDRFEGFEGKYTDTEG